MFSRRYASVRTARLHVPRRTTATSFSDGSSSSRIVPPWKRVDPDARAEDYFGGVMASRNPLMSARTAAARAAEQEELAEATAVADAMGGRDEQIARDVAAARTARDERRGTFRPYGGYTDHRALPEGTSSTEAHAASATQQVPHPAEASPHYDAPLAAALLRNDASTPLPLDLDQLALRVRDGAWPFGGACGLALDMDGVLTLGRDAVEGSREALEFLTKARVPFILLSNSGGVTEAEKAQVLSKQLGVAIEADQIVQGHTPMRLLGEGAGPLRNTEIVDNGVPRQRFGPNDFTLIVGPRSAVEVAESYGFWQPLHVRDIQARRAELVPLKDWSGDATFWRAKPPADVSALPPGAAPRIVAVCVMAPNGVDAFSDLQIVLDAILALPVGQIASAAVSQRQELPVYFAGDDLLYMGQARTPRLGLGAIREMWTSVVESVTGRPLHAIIYGKPRRISYLFAERQLRRVSQRLGHDPQALRVACMVGDSIETDLAGANAMADSRSGGLEWLSAHVLTGVANATSACRTVAPQDAEGGWLAEHYAPCDVTPHYVAPSFRHFVGELVHFDESAIMNVARGADRPAPPLCPVDLRWVYNWSVIG